MAHAMFVQAITPWPLVRGTVANREVFVNYLCPLPFVLRTTIRLIKIDEFVLRELFFKNQTDAVSQEASRSLVRLGVE